MRGEAGGDEVDEDDLREGGVPPDEIAKLREVLAARGGGEVGITPDNWLAVRVFWLQSGRWRRMPSGRLDGLDMTQVESTLNLLGVRRGQRGELLHKLLAMEAEAIEVMAA